MRITPNSGGELTKAEWRVIKAVWETEPCTAPQIQQRLEKRTGWTYSTVRTLMDRMVSKGLLRADKVRKPTQFSSVLTREKAQRGELLYALRHAFNGALAPMLQCLLETSELSEDELAKLEELIKARKKGGKHQP